MAEPYPLNLNTPTTVTYMSPLANSYETPVKQFTQILQVSTNNVVSVRTLNTFLRGSGTATASSGLVLASGAVPQSLAAAESQQFVYSASGSTQIVKFSALFSAGVAGVTQLAGYGNSGEGYFFGYNGTSFGVLCRSSGLPQVVNITVTAGTGTVAGTLTITLNSVAFNIVVPANTSIYGLVALIMSTSFTTAGSGSGWTLNQLGTTITFTAMTSGVRNGVYTYTKGVTTITLTIATTLAGVAMTDLWIPQSSWSLDPADGSHELGVLNPLNGNIYQVSVETFNYGIVTFYVVDSVTGRYYPVHQQSLRTVTPMTQESCPIRISIENNAITTPVQITVPDMSATIYGSTDMTQFPPFCTYTNIYPNIPANVVQNMLSLKNNVVFSGLLNKSTVRLTSITIGVNGNYGLFFPLVKNSSYTAVPAAGFTWTQSDTESVTSYAKVNTFNLTGGQNLCNLSIGASDQVTVDLIPFYIHLEPGDELNIGMASTQPGTAVGSSVIYASISWIETR